MFGWPQWLDSVTSGDWMLPYKNGQLMFAWFLSSFALFFSSEAKKHKKASIVVSIHNFTSENILGYRCSKSWFYWYQKERTKSLDLDVFFWNWFFWMYSEIFGEVKISDRLCPLWSTQTLRKQNALWKSTTSQLRMHIYRNKWLIYWVTVALFSNSSELGKKKRSINIRWQEGILNLTFFHRGTI